MKQLLLAIALLVYLFIPALPQSTTDSPNVSTQTSEGSADEYIERGNELRHKGDYDGAISEYTQAIEKDETYLASAKPNAIQTAHFYERLSGAYLNRALARVEQHEYDRAISDLNRAIEIRPQYVDAYNQRGVARKNKNDLQGAITDFNKALELNPQYAAAYVNRGLARDLLGDPNGAIKDYNKALQIEPNDAIAYMNRGLVLGDRNDFKGAIADYNRAIEIKPDFIEALEMRGMLLLALGRDAEAERDIKRCLELNPSLKPKLEQVASEIKGKRKVEKPITTPRPLDPQPRI
jgi:tetratricopeptide (TPR) repeat protein